MRRQRTVSFPVIMGGEHRMHGRRRWVAAITAICVAAPAVLSAQENSDADELHRLRWRDAIAARELQDERLRTCFNPLTPPSAAIEICTWVIDAARVAGNYAGEAHVRRAAAYAALGDVQRADEDFEYGTRTWDQVAPDAPPSIESENGPPYGFDRARHANAHCERGDFYWRQGDTERAITSYRRAQEYDPQCAATPLTAIAAGQASPRGALRDRGRYDAAQHLNVTSLATACATQRTAALSATYGPGATAEQAAGLDGAFAQSPLSSRDTSTLIENLRAFEAGAADNAALAYAACLYRQRLTSIDPQWEEAANEAAEAEEPEDDPFANLPRREAGAGTQFLADSADPNVRAARLRAAAERAAQAERRREERRRQSAQMWDTILQVAAIGAQTYLEYESQRVASEAAAQQQAAILAQQQAQAQQAARQQQQASNPYPQQQRTSTATGRDHNPANDASQCMQVVNVNDTTAKLANQCGYSVEVVWCTEGNPDSSFLCPSRGMWTWGPGAGPSFRRGTSIHFGACRGPNSITSQPGGPPISYACPDFLQRQ